MAYNGLNDLNRGAIGIGAIGLSGAMDRPLTSTEEIDRQQKVQRVMDDAPMKRRLVDEEALTSAFNAHHPGGRLVIDRRPSGSSAGVRYELERLEKATMVTTDLINDLFARLDPLLKPSPPEGVDANGTESAPETAMAGEMRRLSANVAYSNQRLLDIIQRLGL